MRQLPCSTSNTLSRRRNHRRLQTDSTSHHYCYSLRTLPLASPDTLTRRRRPQSRPAPRPPPAPSPLSHASLLSRCTLPSQVTPPHPKRSNRSHDFVDSHRPHPARQRHQLRPGHRGEHRASSPPPPRAPLSPFSTSRTVSTSPRTRTRPTPTRPFPTPNRATRPRSAPRVTPPRPRPPTRPRPSRPSTLASTRRCSTMPSTATLARCTSATSTASPSSCTRSWATQPTRNAPSSSGAAPTRGVSACPAYSQHPVLTPTGRANAACILACYMVLIQSWPPHLALAPIAQMDPPCMPFRDAGYSQADYVLNIQDVIYGVWKAKEEGLCGLKDFSLEE